MRRFLVALASSLLLTGACARPQDRQPAVAGQFYPAQKQQLSAMLRELFAGAVSAKGKAAPIALIVPHAGYVYSGGVAASAYSRLSPDAAFENVFLLGPSHHVGFEGAAVYAGGDFITPLGKVPVNRELSELLVKTSPLFSTRMDAHRDEHSLEVQLPFLQYRLKGPFRIVPIVFGTNSPSVCATIAGILRPYLTSRNLFIISTDFSHYPSYDAATIVDRACADAIVANSGDGLLKVLDENQKRRVPNLATSMCGWTGVLTLLEMTRGKSELQYDLIQYKNSGDAPAGNKESVVGYCAIALTQSGKEAGFSLDKTEREELLKIARRSVEEFVKHKRLPDVTSDRLTATMKTPAGAFVTLKKHEELRGCIGRFDATEPLFRIVQQMAVAAATEDYRFSPVRVEELTSIEFEISVLTPLRRIRSAEEIEMGKHGVYIRKGGRSGTFLPQVAEETGWTREEFLGHCSQDKAGIGWDGWKDAELYVYEALVFSEKEQ